MFLGEIRLYIEHSPLNRYIRSQRTPGTMLLAFAVTIGALIFATLILLTLFRNLSPAIVEDGYVPCRGHWYEARANGCEHGLTHIPQQPINTYTNLAYLAVGVFVALSLGTAPAYVFAFTMLYLFIGSTLYHALSTHWAGMLDVTAIYSLFSALAVYGLCELLGLPVWLTTGIMFAVAGLTAYVLSPRYRKNMNLVIGLFLGATYVLLLLHMWRSGLWSAWPYLVGSLVAYGTAFIIWNVDKTETSPFKKWGHGIWHILAAAASALIFYAVHLTTL